MVPLICFYYRHISHFMFDVPYPSPQRPRILVQVRTCMTKCQGPSHWCRDVKSMENNLFNLL